MMAQQPVLEFAGLLRQLRTEVRLTQEELAATAGLSPRSISDLERGINRTARNDTALLLADALGLAEPVRALFVAAARGRGPVAEVLAARKRVAGQVRGTCQYSSARSSADGELARLAAALRASPLVTVTGPGGVGKTRLVLQAAADQVPLFGDGVWLCELASAQNTETMTQVVAAALHVRPRPGLSTAGSVVEFLRTRTALLLVLDNCEHLLAAAATLTADILHVCRGVRIVATTAASGGRGRAAVRAKATVAPARRRGPGGGRRKRGGVLVRPAGRSCAW